SRRRGHRGLLPGAPRGAGVRAPVRDRAVHAQPPRLGRDGGRARGRSRAGALRPEIRGTGGVGRREAAQGPGREVGGMRAQSRATSWALLSPWVIAFGLFGLYPFGFSLVASLTDYSPIHAGRASFVGLANYGQALADPEFWSAL